MLNEEVGVQAEVLRGWRARVRACAVFGLSVPG